MDLKEISKKYQENLIQFFNNDQVIDIIYEEQYGKHYAENKEKCKEEYKHLLNSTIFVPYITIEHLQNYIDSYKMIYGEDYVKCTLKDENDLLSKLCAKREQIIDSYYSNLFQDLRVINSKLNNVDLSQALYYEENNHKKRLTNPDLINSNLENILNNSQKTFNPFKNKKIKQLLAKYPKDIKEKLLMETSTYFMHRADMIEKADSVPLIQYFEGSQTLIDRTLLKDSQKNCRYIYLPILGYCTKQDYLKDAVHEVMHVSKEKISGLEYKSGLMRTQTENKNPIINFIQSLRWKKLKSDLYKSESIEFPHETEKYESSSGRVALEENLHHWQVQEVVRKILNSPVQEEFKMPYINKRLRTTTTSYERANATTEKFMNFFKQDVQSVNYGNMSVRDFEKKIGPSLSSLGHLYDIWTSPIPKIASVQGAAKNEQTNGKTKFSRRQPFHEMNEMGDFLVHKMTRTSVSDNKKDIDMER